MVRTTYGGRPPCKGRFVSTACLDCMVRTMYGGRPPCKDPGIHSVDTVSEDIPEACRGWGGGLKRGVVFPILPTATLRVPLGHRDEP